MKKFLLHGVTILFLCSCGAGRKSSTGCPMQNGAMDAKRLAEGDPKAMKEAKKLKKFKY